MITASITGAFNTSWSTIETNKDNNTLATVEGWFDTSGAWSEVQYEYYADTGWLKTRWDRANLGSYYQYFDNGAVKMARSGEVNTSTGEVYITSGYAYSQIEYLVQFSAHRKSPGRRIANHIVWLSIVPK